MNRRIEKKKSSRKNGGIPPEELVLVNIDGVVMGPVKLRILFKHYLSTSRQTHCITTAPCGPHAGP